MLIAEVLGKFLLLVVCVEASAPWILRNSVADKGWLNTCVVKCEQLNAQIRATIGPSGHCECDSFLYSPQHMYVYRQGQSLAERSLIFLPFTNDFNSIGTATTPVQVYGTPMVFTQDGPNGPSGKKALQYKTTSLNYFIYTVPETVVTKVRTDGAIVTLWIKFTSSGEMPIFMFVDDNIMKSVRFAFWQFHAGKFYVQLGYQAHVKEVAGADTAWHHVAIIFKAGTKHYQLRIDGVAQGTDVSYATMTEDIFTNKLEFRRYRYINTWYADAALSCFVVQELGTKTNTQIDDAINEAKGGCN